MRHFQLLPDVDADESARRDGGGLELFDALRREASLQLKSESVGALHTCWPKPGAGRLGGIASLDEMSQARIPGEYRGGQTIDEDALEALAERRNAIVGTLNENGTIHMTPVWFLYENGLIYFETNSATRKARNVAERQALTVLIPGTHKDVIAMGLGRLIYDEEGMEINRRVRAKYVTEEGEGPVGRFFERIDDVAVELRPSSIATWTNSKLRESLRSIPEYTPEAAATWFRPKDG